MPLSKTCLPDVNVWVALAYEAHVHHRRAVRWFDEEQSAVAFCRVTQMGLLRLITNAKVMGENALTPQKAWHHYDQLRQNPRISFLNEPADLEPTWRSMSHQKQLRHSWTDAYLLAFAQARYLTFVTFDKALRTLNDASVVILA